MTETYTDNDYSDRLVAFLDILGFRRLIFQDTKAALRSANMIDRHLKHILTIMFEDYGKSFSTKLFSDCLCISCEYTDENIFYIMFELAYIQYYLSMEGIFLRGALSRGYHFENDRMIFSEGLVKAYELEKTAIYPRILIDSCIVDSALNDHNEYYPIYNGFLTKDFIIYAPDGKTFIDYLQQLHQEGMDPRQELRSHRHAIESSVKSHREETLIVNKYRWLADYHNLKCKEHFDREDYNEQEYVELLRETTIDIDSLFLGYRKP